MKEKVIAGLSEIYEAKTIIEINDLLGLSTAEELKELQDTLELLVTDNIMYQTKKDKYILIQNCPGFKMGKLSLNKKGFGFVLLDKEDDLYIPEENLNGATHDDLVLAEITRNGIKREGRILKILNRSLQDLVGELVKDHKGEFILKLDDKRKDLEILIDRESTKDCVEGHKVLVKIIKELGKKKYLASVAKIIGHKDDPQTDILSIAYKFGFDPDFGKEVEEQLETIPSEVDEKELINRRDLTNEMIFTIDGSHTKDIDDAISYERISNLHRLGVHIADVSNYVKENTALGDAAYQRGTSAYLADTVIPMLPHKLSNGICSLNEGVVRLTMSCVMDINDNGEVVNYEIFPSYIKSRKKMTYEAVNDILMRDIVAPGYEEYANVLKDMNHLAHILQKAIVKRGYINFDIDEAEVVQDENGVAIDIIKREREDGEKLIESFMIAANETVAAHVYNMELPFVYRVHGKPNSEKIDDFVQLVKIMGHEIKNGIQDLSPKSMQRILDELNDIEEIKILSVMLLRSMKKAEYSSDNIGHFGLASETYTHFTSPIRRFPDLTVHRLLKKYFVEQDLSMQTIRYLENNLVELCEHSSARELASVNAEREVLDMKMAEYMEAHIGEEYEGVVNTVANFGFFVELPNLVEGLVAVKSLKDDFYEYVPEQLALIGERTKKTYRIGDKVKVKCVAASKETAMIDFELVESGEENVGSN